MQKLNGIVWPHIRVSLSGQLKAIRNEVISPAAAASAGADQQTTVIVCEAAVLGVMEKTRARDLIGWKIRRQRGQPHRRGANDLEKGKTSDPIYTVRCWVVLMYTIR